MIQSYDEMLKVSFVSEGSQFLAPSLQTIRRNFVTKSKQDKDAEALPAGELQGERGKVSEAEASIGFHCRVY